jgi:hypothetical protein
LSSDSFDRHRANAWTTEDLAVSTLDFDSHDPIAVIKIILKIVLHHCEQLIPSGEAGELDATLWFQGINFFVEV